MRRRSRLVEAIATHARLVLVGCLLATLCFGAGIPALETDTTLEQFRTDTPESEALAYADRHFEERDENTTAVHVVVTDENALERESLLEGLRFQQSLRQDETIGPTLVENDSTIGVENVVATAIIRLEQADELENRSDDLETRVSDIEERIDDLDAALERVGSLQADYEVLNDSYAAGEVSDEEYDRRSTAIEADLDATVSNATADLESERTAQFERAAATVRAIETEMADLERQRAAGTVTDREYEARMEVLVDDREQTVVDGSRWLFGDEHQSLQQEAKELEDERDAIERLDRPPLEEQISALERADDDRFDRAITLVLAEDGPGSAAALRLLPSSYEPGSLESDERLLLVTQSLDRGSGPPGEIGPGVVESQLALEERVLERGEENLVFGMGLVADEVDRAVSDSLVIVGPLALLFVIVALAIAYRDVLDIALGVAGTAAVLVWTLGMAGWAGVAFTQVFVAVPVLLIGLSIDYAIHVVMRHREEREGGDDVRTSMAGALAGLSTAFVLVTTTTAIGFLANVVSPIDPIREFGAVSAFGIVSALVVFGAAVPAAKVELDAALEARGFDRRRRAIGGSDRVAGTLAVGAIAARKAPLVVLVCALLVTAGGAYGATHVDTTFDERSFLAGDSPSWTGNLGPLAPGEYRMQSSLDVLEERYQREGGQVQILLRGDVTAGGTLQRVEDATARAEASEVVYVLPDGKPDVRSPLSVMRATADESESFNATFSLADRTGNRVPNQNHLGLYDGLFEYNPDSASDLVYRSESGEYEAIRLLVGVQTSAESDETAAEMRAVAAVLEGDGDSGDAVATGGPLNTYALERTLFESVVGALAVALGAIVALLAVGYRLTGRGATLGAVAAIPVLVALGATLGTMALLGLPFNVLTGMVASLTIGLGIDYSVHVTTRYTRELEALEAGVTAWDALERTLSTTGGALAGSVATTGCGFGVLVVALVPLLRQFGLVTALTIGYAFLASILVLPTLLATWTRYLAPEPYRVPSLADVPWRTSLWSRPTRDDDQE
ncbi:efflux RND transporter permease subunit [Natronosalvus rutilus]|uniref:MMPL family transporter n=1 Tax=Natronosalvus rutilus TaxID=2953753 RepID=A0A9E7SXN5_9EURY|nr:MMPL family transporter [Natronosalvus rutilus]UTF55256.1 MMPL family transporter [Natronosalvus rutilus]